MLRFDPPRIQLSLGQAALHEPYPTWLLDPYGVIRSANLMALWLWGGLKAAESIQPDLLLGRSIFFQKQLLRDSTDCRNCDNEEFGIESEKLNL